MGKSIINLTYTALTFPGVINHKGDVADKRSW